jgi:hypothetical protein
MGKKTWLLRGGAVAVFAVLAGAWGVGFADLDDSSPSAQKPPAPVAPEVQPRLDGQRWVVLPEAQKPRRSRDRDVAQAVLTEPGADAADAPTASPDAAPPTSTAPDPDPSSSPDPSPSQPGPSNPPSTPPTNPPSEPPGEPADGCTELGDVVDCVLDPITGSP